MLVHLKSELLKLELVIPNEDQTDLLYQQLCSRNHSISHVGLPSFQDHQEFVANHPYRAWYIITFDNNILGSVYIQYDNSIGLNCCEEISVKQLKSILDAVTNSLRPLPAKPSVRVDKFFLNVAASNLTLQNKLKILGLKESQRSFIL